MRPRLIHSFVAAATVALFLAASQRASADTLSLTFAGTTNAGFVTHSTNPTVAITLNGSSSNVSAGPYFWTPPNSGSSPLATFCIELTQGIPSGAISYTVQSPATAPTINSTPVANAIEALYGDYYKTAWSSPATATSDTSFKAFQLALWELTYDGTADLANTSSTTFLTSGKFQSTDPCAAAAQTMLHTALGNVSGGDSAFNANFPGMQLEALVSSCSQDQLCLLPGPKVVPGVPAPPGVVLAGLGLFALVGRSRWNRRTPNAA